MEKTGVPPQNVEQRMAKIFAIDTNKFFPCFKLVKNYDVRADIVKAQDNIVSDLTKTNSFLNERHPFNTG